jgi:hypothetical protein
MASEFEQLQLLKEWTKLYGALHDSQVEQLKYWPLTLTHAVKAEILFNFEARTVIYNIEKTKGKKPKDLPKRLKILEFYTRWLLGEDYNIIVQKGETVWFYSKGLIHGIAQGTDNTTDGKTSAGRRRVRAKGVEAKKGTPRPTSNSGKDV